MAIITLPTTLMIGSACGMGQRRFDLLSQSEPTGAQQVRLLAPPRWTLNLVQPDKLRLAEAGAWVALLAQLRGRVNVLAACDPVRPAPLGTLRGALTLAALAGAGATAISVTGGAGQAGKTLLAGDWLSIGAGLGSSQQVMVMATTTTNASGVASVAIEPPLRTGFAISAVVTWDKPLAYYRLQNDASSWTYGGGGTLVSGIALDLMETWS